MQYFAGSLSALSLILVVDLPTDQRSAMFKQLFFGAGVLLMVQSARLRWMLLDRYRLLRSFVVGALISVPLALLISPREALAIGMLGSLVVDVCLVCRAAWRIDETQTKQFFSALREGPDHLVERTIGLNLLGFGIISLCVSDLGPHVYVSVLPRDLRVLVFFFSVLLIWMALHHGFAVHYASLYFKRKSQTSDSSAESIFEFPGGHSPVFFDFVYVAYTVGMTFEMSDVGARTTEVRKIVVVQSLLAFLYTTIAISAFISLFTL